MSKKWFEMNDLRSKNPDKSVWVTLRSAKEVDNGLKYATSHYKSEYFGVNTLMISLEDQELITDLEWGNVGLSLTHGLNYIWGKYEPIELFIAENFTATHLVINQNFDNTFDDNVWHLNQDLFINLSLKREGDVWVCTRRAYEIAVQLERNEEGNPVAIKIKNEYLKDYLCARKAGLFVTSYFSREQVLDYKMDILGSEDIIQDIDGKDIYECRIQEIHEGGMRFGEKIAVSHVGRTDVNEEDDIPDMSAVPSNDNTKSSFEEKYAQGKKLYRTIAEVWKNNWINPANNSPLVLGEEIDFDLQYIIDESGQRMSNKQLEKERRWLWFRPELINAILSKRGSSLTWYTAHTGGISCAPSFGIHFGVNPLGFINVYAKDVAKLPYWQQQIWYGFNTSPDGGISKELLSSQVKAIVADSLPPETYLVKAIEHLNQLCISNFSFQLFNDHHSTKELIEKIHRFRSIDESGLLALAKDITRLVVDRINLKGLKSHLKNKELNKLRSLKLMEKLLASHISEEGAKKVMSPLFGVNELRNADAHLPSSELTEYYELAGVSQESAYITQGYDLIRNMVDHLYLIVRILDPKLRTQNGQ